MWKKENVEVFFNPDVGILGCDGQPKRNPQSIYVPSLFPSNQPLGMKIRFFTMIVVWIFIIAVKHVETGSDVSWNIWMFPMHHLLMALPTGSALLSILLVSYFTTSPTSSKHLELLQCLWLWVSLTLTSVTTCFDQLFVKGSPTVVKQLHWCLLPISLPILHVCMPPTLHLPSLSRTKQDPLNGRQWMIMTSVLRKKCLLFQVNPKKILIFILHSSNF